MEAVPAGCAVPAHASAARPGLVHVDGRRQRLVRVQRQAIIHPALDPPQHLSGAFFALGFVRAAYFVPYRENAYWTQIGAAWKHQDEEGFTIRLDLLPNAPGDIVLRKQKPKGRTGRRGGRASAPLLLSRGGKLV